jgi:hypothetical protein
MALSDDRQYAPAMLRNRDSILDVRRDAPPMTGVILEIASGSGAFRPFREKFCGSRILIPMHG